MLNTAFSAFLPSLSAFFPRILSLTRKDIASATPPMIPHMPSSNSQLLQHFLFVFGFVWLVDLFIFFLIQGFFFNILAWSHSFDEVSIGYQLLNSSRCFSCCSFLLFTLTKKLADVAAQPNTAFFSVFLSLFFVFFFSPIFRRSPKEAGRRCFCHLLMVASPANFLFATITAVLLRTFTRRH